MVLIPGLFLLMAAPPENPGEALLKRVTELFAIVEREAADPVTSDQALFQGAIPGMLRQLDPHSVFFDAQQFAQLKQMEQSLQKGFGTVVSIVPGRVIVLQVLPGTPSARSGLQPGDEIVGVGQYVLANLDMDQLVQLLGAARQQTVQLTIRRPGNSRLQPYTMTPEAMDAPSVDRAFLLEPGVGYVRVASFDGKTGSLVREAIEQLGGKALRGLVLDLRNNPGGVLEAGLETAALFLPAGTRILTVRGRGKDARQEIDVPKGFDSYAFPLAILVNEKSASAAEVVAGAIQDHDRGAVIGVPTFGKGLVQRVYPLGQETGLALTTAFYYTPSGRSIQKPLRSGALGSVTAAPEAAPTYRTDKGRPVQGGGGILPDQVVGPEELTRFRAVMEGTGVFARYATEIVRKQTIAADFQVGAPLMDDFKVFLSERRIAPSLAEWSAEREWVRSRLQQEVLNQSVGVAKGDEVEAQRDPQMRAARESLR